MNSDAENELMRRFNELVPLTASARRGVLDQLNDAQLRHQLEVLLAADKRADKKEVWQQDKIVGDGYVVEALLGQGGQGQVYRAITGRFPVALKRVFLTNPIGQSERRAVELLCKIKSHPHLLSMHRFWFIGDDELVIAMDLAETNLNMVLKQRLREGYGGLELPHLLKYMEETAEALDYLHSPIHGEDGEKSSVVHRDIKPHNILLCGGAVKVGDYGIARVLTQPGLQPGTMVCSYPYAAPEVYNGQVCIHSDQYSLAATYVELRTGACKRPADLANLVAAEANVIRTALDEHPNKRYPNCGEFVSALRESLSNILPSVPMTETPSVMKASQAIRKSSKNDKPDESSGIRWMAVWVFGLILTTAMIGEYFVLQRLGVLKNDRVFPPGHPARVLFAEADNVKTASFVRRNMKWGLLFYKIETINNIPHGHYDFSCEYEIWNISSDTTTQYPLVHQFEVSRSETRDEISGFISIMKSGELGPSTPKMKCLRKPGTLSFVYKHEFPIAVGETVTVKIEIKDLVRTLPYSDYFVGRWPTDSMELNVNFQEVQMDGDILLLRDKANVSPEKVIRPDGSVEKINLTAVGPFLPYQGIYCTLYPGKGH